jgi:hypothetical protein
MYYVGLGHAYMIDVPCLFVSDGSSAQYHLKSCTPLICSLKKKGGGGPFHIKLMQTLLVTAHIYMREIILLGNDSSFQRCGVAQSIYIQGR